MSEKIKDQVARVMKLAQARRTTVATVESCTAGSLAHLLSQAEGTSDTLQGGCIVYTKENKTARSRGAAKVTPAEYPRFVIQKHDATRLHYDIRLEVDGVFKSWAVTKGFSLDPKDKRLAVETEDHPLDYGDFEGTIPKGEYGGGTVMLWDRGFWAADGDAAKALRKGELRFTLVGEKLQGSWVLVRLRHDREHGKRTNWLLIKRHDGYEREDDGEAILGQDRSVASGRGMTSLPARAEARSPSCWTRRTASKRTRSGIRTGTRAKGHAHLPYLRARR